MIAHLSTYQHLHVHTLPSLSIQPISPPVHQIPFSLAHPGQFKFYSSILPFSPIRQYYILEHAYQYTNITYYIVKKKNQLPLTLIITMPFLCSLLQQKLSSCLFFLYFFPFFLNSTPVCLLSLSLYKKLILAKISMTSMLLFQLSCIC